MTERVIYWWGDWWGSPEAMVRCERPEDLPHELRKNESVIKAVDHAKAQLPGRPVQFGAVRELSANLRVRPLTLEVGQAVNVAYLEWAERYVEVERWERTAIRGGEFGAIVGFVADEKEPVALIALRNL